MKHISEHGFGLLVGILLATTVASLSTDFKSNDWYQEDKSPVKDVPVKPNSFTKEQMFLHRPGKESNARKVLGFLRGPGKGPVKLPTKTSQPPVLRSHGVLKPFGNVNRHEHQGPVEVIANKALLDLQPGTKPRSGLLQRRDHPEGSELHHGRAMAGQPTLWSLIQSQKDLGQVHANSMQFDGGAGKMLAPTIVVLVMLLLVLAFTCFVADPEDTVTGVDDGYSKTADDTPARRKSFGAQTANTKERLRQLENSSGTWATTYRMADKGSKEALELLFRCNIIPAYDFAEGYVSQEHIDECIWISTQMLREKSLNEWVEVWPQAMTTFEESVTACFAARTDVISNLGEQTPPKSLYSPRSQIAFVDCSPGMAQSQPRDGLSHASTGWAPTLVEECTSPSAPVRSVLARYGSLRAVPVPPTSTFGVGSQDVSTGQRISVRLPHTPPSPAPPSPGLPPVSVVSRCREIMSSIPVRAAPLSEPSSPEASPPSTSQSMHVRDLSPPVFPAAAAGDNLGGQGRGHSRPRSRNRLPGATPQTGELVPTFGSLPATAPQQREPSPRFSSLPGTTPDPTDLAQRQV